MCVPSVTRAVRMRPWRPSSHSARRCSLPLRRGAVRALARAATPELRLGRVAAAYAVASGALAWGAAAGWGDPAFRVYYLFGGLLTAPLLGAGSLLLAGRRWAAPVGLVWWGSRSASRSRCRAPGTRDAIKNFRGAGAPGIGPGAADRGAGNALGTLAAIAVALLTLRRRPLGNTLILAGIAVAAVGSALAGLGAAETAFFIALAAVLLYAGFVTQR